MPSSLLSGLTVSMRRFMSVLGSGYGLGVNAETDAAPRKVIRGNNHVASDGEMFFFSAVSPFFVVFEGCGSLRQETLGANAYGTCSRYVLLAPRG